MSPQKPFPRFEKSVLVPGDWVYRTRARGPAVGRIERRGVSNLRRRPHYVAHACGERSLVYSLREAKDWVRETVGRHQVESER